MHLEFPGNPLYSVRFHDALHEKRIAGLHKKQLVFSKGVLLFPIIMFSNCSCCLSLSQLTALDMTGCYLVKNTVVTFQVP